MPYSIQTKDGIVINNIPDDIPQDADILKQRVAALRSERDKETSTNGIDRLIGTGEAGLALASGTAAEVAGGLAGVAQTLNPLASEGAGARAVETVRDALTFEPRTESGKAQIGAVADFVEPLTNILESAENTLGDFGGEVAGPVGSAVGATIPTALSLLTPIKVARVAKRISDSVIAPVAREVIDAGKRLKVPVLTTDVAPPTTFLGKFTQQLSEKLGPLGSGTARSSQQVARQNVVEGLAAEFGVQLDSPFVAEIVTSLQQKSAKVLADASAQRNSAVTSLVEFGEVPIQGTITEIDKQIARQTRLGAKGDQALMKNLEDIKSSIPSGDFALIKDIRTEVIDDLKALSRSEDRRAEGALTQVKKAIDKDLTVFAVKNDPVAARDWRQSNATFADELGNVRDTELKRILNLGEATPEKILPIIKGGKRSELARLNKSLTPEGRTSARAAIVADALDESGFFRGDINPDRLATALNKTKRKQAIDIFFDGKAKREIQGLSKLLDATKRAQQAAAAPPTGVQTIPLLTTAGVGAGVATDAVTTFGTVGTLAGIAKAYESTAFRTLLLKIANSKKGSRIETGLLEAAVPSVIAGLQASKAQQEQTVQK